MYNEQGVMNWVDREIYSVIVYCDLNFEIRIHRKNVTIAEAEECLRELRYPENARIVPNF